MYWIWQIIIYWFYVLFIFVALQIIFNFYKYPSIPTINSTDNKGIIISVCGVSGSGKSTFCKRIIEQYPNFIYVDLDMIYFKECNANSCVFAKYLCGYLKHNKGKNLLFDGNYNAARKQVWNRCDYIYYLKINPFIRINNVIKREFWNSLYNNINNIGNPSNIRMLFYNMIFDCENSLIWHASGYDFQKEQLDEGVITYLYESQKNYLQHIRNRNEKIKNGQTPKELQKEPCDITYLRGYFY